MEQAAAVAEWVAQCARIALANLHREYPNQIGHRLDSAADAQPPQRLTPIFYGCYDWHSAVHSHWLLVRALHLFPNGNFVEQAMAALNQSFTAPNAAGELAYLQARPSFERPYGLAWLLQLMAELRGWGSESAERWLAILAELETLAADRFAAWLPKLSHPIRSGTHSQSAFALALLWDWAQAAERAEIGELVAAIANRFFAADVEAPLAYEPSGTDFLSPALGEADLMRRVLPTAEFAVWLSRFLPRLGEMGVGLEPVGVADAADGQLAHFAGLNLSRGWMLQGIANALAVDDKRRGPLITSAEAHSVAGLRYIDNPDYMLTHWLPSFAVYFLTGGGQGNP